MKYIDITQNTTRLVVEYVPAKDREPEGFRWGMVGAFPQPFSLVGYIVAVQNQLVPAMMRGVDFAYAVPKQCPEPALVIVLCPDGTLDHFVNDEIPVYPLVGMLETIKLELLADINAWKQLANVGTIVGPDGRPVRVR